MLVLSRKRGEEVVIPSLNIAIRLIEIRGDRARLGIDAPSHIGVHRKEVWARMQEWDAEAPLPSKQS